ncbi:MAG: hypothetical protein V7K48_27890 [Nostoc sp.]|uniref:hypothetical protein n=1 Tax=Nostoc sp. TaxID=1180 RepID=UPI002FF8A236
MVALSACTQPVTETRTAIVPPITPTLTAIIATQNLAELAKSAASQGQFKNHRSGIQCYIVLCPPNYP